MPILRLQQLLFLFKAFLNLGNTMLQTQLLTSVSQDLGLAYDLMINTGDTSDYELAITSRAEPKEIEVRTQDLPHRLQRDEVRELPTTLISESP
jgi:hypothetical protein